jgi:hypothetical protein
MMDKPPLPLLALGTGTIASIYALVTIREPDPMVRARHRSVLVRKSGTIYRWIYITAGAISSLRGVGLQRLRNAALVGAGASAVDNAIQTAFLPLATRSHPAPIPKGRSAARLASLYLGGLGLHAPVCMFLTIIGCGIENALRRARRVRLIDRS